MKPYNVKRQASVARHQNGWWRLLVVADGLGTRGWAIVSGCVQSVTTIPNGTVYSIYPDVNQEDMWEMLARLEKELGFEVVFADDTFSLSEKVLAES